MEKDNIQEKRIENKKEKAWSMNDEKSVYRRIRILLVIFVILFSFAAIIRSYSNHEIQMNRICLDTEDGSRVQLHPQGENVLDLLSCLPDYKDLLKLYIFGLINIDELTAWVLGVDRRLIVLKIMHEKRLLQASEIADTTERSLQNISYAMRELEEQGLIKCLTPGKHTWKKYIPTERGTEVFLKLKKNHLLGN